jgi:hypothetical protein
MEMADVLYVGGKTYMVTRVETTYGTDAAGTDDKMALVTNFTSNMKNNMIPIYTLGGGRSYQQIVPGKFEASGSVEWEVSNGTFLKYCIGALSAATTTTTNFDGTTITGTPTSALKRYAITESDALPSFTMQLTNQSDASATDIKTIYTGVKVNQLSLKFDTENPLHATMDWIAQKPLTSTGDYSALAPVAYKDVPQMFYRGQLLVNTGDYGLAGTGSSNTMTDTTKAWTADQWKTSWVVIDSLGAAFVITGNAATTLTVVGTPTTGKYVIVPLSTTAANQVIQCNSIDVTLAQNLEPYWSVANDTARGVKFLVEKNREYTLTLDLNFTSVDQLGRFYTGAITGLSPTTTSDYTKFIVCIDCKTAVADGDNYRALKMVFTDVVFDENTLPVNPKDINKQTLTAKARNCMGFYITNETQNL